MMLRLIALTVAMVYSGIAQGPLRFELKRVEKKTTSCIITFEYPEIISAATPQARDRINAGIRRVLLRHTDWPAHDSGLASIDAYANEFMTYCAEYQKGPQPRELYQHKMVTIFRYTPPVLSFKCDADEDGGGVHPFGTTLFVNFESSTGKTVTLTDLLGEGDLAKFESVAEAKFRRDYKLSLTESLSEQGFGFPGDRFKLNNNFGIGEREVVFLFNTYEIGPGAMGPTELTIPWVFVRDLFRPALHLW
jgi:hypothetical protein